MKVPPRDWIRSLPERTRRRLAVAGAIAGLTAGVATLTGAITGVGTIFGYFRGEPTEAVELQVDDESLDALIGDWCSAGEVTSLRRGPGTIEYRFSDSSSLFENWRPIRVSKSGTRFLIPQPDGSELVVQRASEGELHAFSSLALAGRTVLTRCELVGSRNPLCQRR